MQNLNVFPGVKIANHMPLIYTPAFWDERKAYAQYTPDPEGAFIEGLNYRRQHQLATADELTKKGVSNISMLTDLQEDFRPSGRLPVMGTDDVVLRVAARLLNGTVSDYFTGVVWSQDGHPDWHISYSARWRDLQGNPFDLRKNKAAVLDLIDDKNGIFRATCFNPQDGSPIDMGPIQSMINIKDTIAYWNYLQQTKQGPIWVFATHCKMGTDGVNLHPLLVEVLAFMSGARMIGTVPLAKGHIRDTDWFGPLQPCRPDPNHPQGGLQKAILDLFEQANRVEFNGVAEDFCDYNMKRQCLEYFAGTSFFPRMAFCVDGTAPIVPNAAHVQVQNNEARSKGVVFFQHDEQFATK